MTSLQYKLLLLLSDGHFHSGEQMARQVGVTRAAVWKALQGLRTLGVTVRAVSGRGYSLVRPFEPLERKSILAQLPVEAREQFHLFEPLHTVDSTNAWLMRQSDEEAIAVCIAEHQSAGRGRRGRQWCSPFGSNLYLSARFRFDEGMGRLSGLSLAAAVAVVRTLREAGVPDTAIKWPNDIYWQGRKLGGILLEVAGESSGPCMVVIGVGLNVAMPSVAAHAIDQPWVDLAAIRDGLSRNQLAGRLLHHMMDVIVTFQRNGLAPFDLEWREADMLYGNPVVLLQPGTEICGVGRGVAHDGALLLEIDGQIQRYNYGEASVRLRAPPA